MSMYLSRQLAVVIMASSLSVPVVYADGDSAAEATYKEICTVCHGADGKGGMPGVPDFTDAEGRLAKDNDTLARHILEGFKSDGSPMAMPPKGGLTAMTHEESMNLVKYLKMTF